MDADVTTVTVTDPRALAVIQAVAVGRSLDELPEGSLPAEEFLLRVATDNELAKAYQRAREISGYALEDEALRLLREQAREPGTQGKLRATESLANMLRWSAEKRNPGVYAKQQAVNLTVPIQINTSLDMGAGGTGTKEHPNIYAIEAQTVQYVDVTPDDVSQAVEQAQTETPEQRRKRLAAGRRKRWRAKKAAKEKAIEQMALDKMTALRGADDRDTDTQDRVQPEPGSEELHREPSEG